MTTLFLEPLDVLYLRGNKLFGGAGDHGEALMPPWPSIAAGALRSRLMAEGDTLETLAGFRLTRFALARLSDDTQANAEALWPLPADVVVTEKTLSDATYLRPTTLPEGIASSHALSCVPALSSARPGKPVSGLFLNAQGIAAWHAQAPLNQVHFVRAGELWETEHRLGIALDTKKRSAADGMIYTTETIAVRKNVGFLAQSTGHEKALPDLALVRLGGDGRAARVRAVQAPMPTTDWSRIERDGRFRLLLTTPGIFPAGWKPDGIPAQLIAASVSRAETLSGWDLVTRQPKPAQLIAPTSSVYWYDKLADLAALKALADNGLPITEPTRHAEGFNHCVIAPWGDGN